MRKAVPTWSLPGRSSKVHIMGLGGFPEPRLVSLCGVIRRDLHDGVVPYWDQDYEDVTCQRCRRGLENSNGDDVAWARLAMLTSWRMKLVEVRGGLHLQSVPKTSHQRNR